LNVFTSAELANMANIESNALC